MFAWEQVGYYSMYSLLLYMMLMYRTSNIIYELHLYITVAYKQGTRSFHFRYIYCPLKLTAVSKALPTLKLSFVESVLCGSDSLAMGCCTLILLQSEHEHWFMCQHFHWNNFVNGLKFAKFGKSKIHQNLVPCGMLISFCRCWSWVYLFHSWSYESSPTCFPWTQQEHQ